MFSIASSVAYAAAVILSLFNPFVAFLTSTGAPFCISESAGSAVKKVKNFLSNYSILIVEFLINLH